MNLNQKIWLLLPMLIGAAGLGCSQSRDNQQKEPSLHISADFAGGNIVVEKIVGDTVWLKPDLRDTEGDWFYWYFSVKSNVSRAVYFKFPPRKIPTFGPAISLDKGRSWNWMYNEPHENMTEFVYQVEKGKETRFSIGFPYTLQNFTSFIEQFDSNPNLTQDVLCKTELGREVPLIHIKNPSNTSPKFQIVFTARHHACEMMANYVLEGIISSILLNEQLAYLRDNCEILIVPFVDFDGVEDGDQGKNRMPRDHNRDYGDESIYETIRAIQSLLKEWSTEGFKIALDLHCPYIAGKDHEYLHFVGSANTQVAENESVFINILRQTTRFEESINGIGVLKFGTAWNVSANESKGMSFRSWIQKEFPRLVLASTLEVPYANNSGMQMTGNNLRLLGEHLALAIQERLSREE